MSAGLGCRPWPGARQKALAELCLKYSCGSDKPESPRAAAPAAAETAAATKGAGKAAMAARLVVLAGGGVGQLEVAVALPIECACGRREGRQE